MVTYEKSWVSMAKKLTTSIKNIKSNHMYVSIH